MSFESGCRACSSGWAGLLPAPPGQRGRLAAVVVSGRGGDLDLPRPVPRESRPSRRGRRGRAVPAGRRLRGTPPLRPPRRCRYVPADGPGRITATRQPGASLTWLHRAHSPVPLPHAVALPHRSGVVGVHDRRPTPRGGAHVVAQHQHPPQQPGEHPPARVHRDQVPPVRGGVQPAQPHRAVTRVAHPARATGAGTPPWPGTRAGSNTERVGSPVPSRALSVTTRCTSSGWTWPTARPDNGPGSRCRPSPPRPRGPRAPRRGTARPPPRWPGLAARRRPRRSRAAERAR